MATITSTQTGGWHETSTWVGGSVPAADDLVVIAHGHKVTLSTDIQSTRTGDVTIDGNLHFANGGKMHLHGRMTVKNTSHNSNSTGEFVQGTAASGSLLSMVGGTEIKISGDNSAQHGIQVDSRKWCGVQIDGSEPTLKTELNGNHDYRSTYLTVDDSANFTANDLISIYRREEDFRLKNDECFWIHDVDTSNHRIYFKHYVYPRAKSKFVAPIIISSVGSSIKVDDASVFRVGYQLIFGTGSDRNVLTVTAINKRTNIITFGSTVTNPGNQANNYVYQTGTEKYHLADSHVRRLSSAMAATYSGAASLRTVVVNNAADFSVGDHIYIEACGDNSYQYTSGSENSIWRHNLMYKISGISGTTLTVDRDILYDGKVGGLITKMTRDVVIKACASNGDDVADGDQDTARVFFNVKYWTSNGWNNAPTRRVKIKYVQFLGLGYNTGDSTNFRAGVTIAGYNGYYDTKITGSAADNTTVHSSSGVSQTGENYVDGCSFSSYNLVSNSTRDGDSYPGICSRHPYGMVFRNHVVVGAGRGVWHWSSQYGVKSHGHIIAACNYVNIEIGAGYEYCNEFSYMYLRMAEDYAFLLYHLRQGTSTCVQHFDIAYQNSYAVRVEYGVMSTIRRIYAWKYRYNYTPDGTDANQAILDSRVYPNYWCASSLLYNCDHTPNWTTSTIANYSSSHNQPYRGTSARSGRLNFLEHGFREEESLEIFQSMAKLVRDGRQDADWIVSPSGTPTAESRIYVPANTAVKIRALVRVNDKTYNGGTDTVDDNSLPVLIARSAHMSALMGRHNSGVVTDTGDVRTFHAAFDLIASSDDRTGLVNSTNARGKLQYGFIEYAAYTSAAQGAWEEKEITVAAQYEPYELIYGFYVDNHDMTDVGFKAMPIEIILAKPSSVNADEFQGTTSLSRKSIRTAFNAQKKRISGRI
tara:strand:- start:1872 stop:4649 length:2778 start_codon:yes stop_codon:yes gene_type:complete